VTCSADVAVGEAAGLGIAVGVGGCDPACAAPHALKATASIAAIRRTTVACILAGGFYEPSDGRINQARTNVSGRLPPLRKPGTRSALLSHQLSMDPSSEGRTAT